MPRGRKKATPLTIEERIDALENELTGLRESITAKEEELNQLKEIRDQKKIKELMDVIAESGKSIQAVIDLVRGETDAGREQTDE